jgi:hypothetical protein
MVNKPSICDKIKYMGKPILLISLARKQSHAFRPGIVTAGISFAIWINLADRGAAVS